jgi:hypothetical protein
MVVNTAADMTQENRAGRQLDPFTAKGFSNATASTPMKEASSAKELGEVIGTPAGNKRAGKIERVEGNH